MTWSHRMSFDERVLQRFGIAAQPTTMNCGVITIPDICQTSRIVAAPGFIRVNFRNTNQIVMVMRNKIRHHDTIAPPVQRRFRSKRSLRYCTDEGNTPAILQQIQNTWPQEAWDLRNDLMALAPYVSQEVLEEAAQSGVLPDAMLLEICLANPDAAQSQEFLDLLANGIPNPLPAYMITLIEDNWDMETPLGLLQRDMASAAAKMDRNMNFLLINEKLKDEPNLNTLRYYYSERDNVTDRFGIVDSYIEEAKFDSSEIVLDQIPIDFDLDDQSIDEYDNYYLYHDLLKSLSDSNRTILDLDSTEIDLLEQIANDNTGPSAIKSRNILCFAFGLCEEYPGNLYNTSQQKSARININPQDVINKAYTILQVNPNPASIYVEFYWKTLNLEGDGLIEISDMNGQTITKHVTNTIEGNWIWDTRKIKPGIYIFAKRKWKLVEQWQSKHRKIIIN